MKKILELFMFIIGLPLVCTLFIKPDKDSWKKQERETGVLDESFQVTVMEDAGSYTYKPEDFTALLLYSLIPEEIAFSSSEDYIVEGDTAQDPEQEYLKALAIVCRTNLAYVWERGLRPDKMDFGQMDMGIAEFYRISMEAAGDTDKRNKFNEAKRASATTMGAVITKEGSVIAAPFFTTSSADMLVKEAGSGKGFSLNYAYELAMQGMDFYEILQYFFGEIKIYIYE